MSARNILVINCGSSSIKFALVNEAQATFPLQGLAECIGSPEAVIHFESAAGKESVKVPNADHQAALAQILPRVEDAALLTGRATFIDDLPTRAGTLEAAIVRSPHGHDAFLKDDGRFDAILRDALATEVSA